MFGKASKSAISDRTDDKELLRLLAKQAEEKSKTGPKKSEDRLHFVINGLLDEMEK
ncbi:hypothetical protein [Streptomyces sp. N35]|uniref:hypothetical protein n=1 Tax=Streptomyces sp. N35 TaxID=2795730 RepID=UPI0018F376FC|nr:hypothetical protein [Streptomyces sp. N35]